VQTKRKVVNSSEGHVYAGVLDDGHWVDAQHLVAGDRLLNSDESWSEVVSVKAVEKPIKAYNLTVANDHTYFIAGAANDNAHTKHLAKAVWVHNDCFWSQTGTLDNPPRHMRPEEVASAYRLQDELGVEVKPFDDQANGDFIDMNGNTYDAMGMPNAYSNWNQGQFFNSIDKHLNKSVDHVVIDFTGSSTSQQNQILDYLAGHSNQTGVNATIFVGLD